MKRLETVVLRMPEQDKDKLKTKFSNMIPISATAWSQEYDDRFLDVCVEILGFEYLINLRYQPSFCETPDILAYTDSREIVAMECKNFWMSRDEREYLESTIGSPENIRVREVDQGLSRSHLENPFYRKLIAVIEKAKSQLNAADENIQKRIMFINFSLDVSAILTKEKIKDSILKPQARNLENDGITPLWFENYDPNNTLV